MPSRKYLPPDPEPRRCHCCGTPHDLCDGEPVYCVDCDEQVARLRLVYERFPECLDEPKNLAIWRRWYPCLRIAGRGAIG